MEKTIAILSMLAEPRNGSAARLFRDEPVLKWALRRLDRASRIDGVTILCWEEQSSLVSSVVGDAARVFNCGPRQSVPEMEMISASRRWADGWRGGLLGTCEFDRGFHGPSMAKAAEQEGAERILLVDPSAGLVDPILLDGMIEYGLGHAELDLCFSPAAPGLGGVLLRREYLNRLAAANKHPGLLLSYQPDAPRHDPLSDPAVFEIPVRLARTTRRFTLDSHRQIMAMQKATAHLNGELISTGALGLLAALESADPAEEFPREIVLELNTERASDPIFWPGKRLSIQRSPMRLEMAARIFDELKPMDDMRLILAGVGDPLLHESVLEIIAAARSAGVAAIAVESDFLNVSAECVAALAGSGVNLVSVHLPAATGQMYRQIMGVDGLAYVLKGIQTFLQSRAGGVPLLVPTFVKCRENQAEMEVWYDHWLRLLGCAVIGGPSDFGGLIPSVAAADMSGAKRSPCRSLSRRLMVLSDGTIVSCEQDVLGRQPLGSTVQAAWRRAKEMRAESWEKHPVCAKCREWHRS